MLKLFCSLYSMGHRKGHKGEEKVQILTVGLGPARFQLQYMGHYVVHDERRDPDPRVQDFVPDNWQGEPLDIVDKNKSAVIMAPKSSGKTYTSYCCMERVLHEGNERMVVYVAPTKENVALSDLGITSVCGKRSKCSCLWVLITVPACFEILLLAPYHQVWVTRIRYVIFDEQETNDIPKTEQCQKSIFQRSCVQRNKVNSFYFANKVVIRKMDARKCEESLKAELTSWVKNGHINKDFQLSVKSSGSEIDQRERTLVLDFSPAPPSMCALSSDGCRQREPFHGPGENGPGECSSSFSPRSFGCSENMAIMFLLLVAKLREMEKLPACFFLARLERVILWETEISEMKKSLEKHYEVPPDCIYTEHSVVDSQMKTATSTLALGVNMPCHMSAHAGRHGEDLTGSVFFGNIPLPKTERPLGSNVPELNDQFPLSLSLVLRRMLLGAKADDKEDASAKALSVLRRSLMSFKQPNTERMLKFYFIYSLQFLVTEVVLKALPEDLATGAEEHNDRVQNVASFLLTISKLAAIRKECQLPLSETGKAENVRAV
ncbi:hypothetical protein MJG53_003141 [Ovis ammon polii x Ovis aries]|uniref:Uncharacterized protein n=1 Tax=Ovis ammon polii x Ovis aries TaxID=2918886 RepID=A0ACB9VG60_9CETA|nr:hypothetical protein MJG53_003141 [Ovis ammon polii x Ovis aries]